MSAPGEAADRVGARPIVWSIAGTDSVGGAGLSADQRAAAALGVHLCPVVAAVTAQNSRAVARVDPVPADWLQAQLDALADDAPPRAIKTGLLGSAGHVAAVARCVDRLRARAPVALVVDPVCAATTGRSFADAAVVRAYRELLLPRATLITPNDREAALLLDTPAGAEGAPALARRLRAAGAQAVAITGGDRTGAARWAMDWIDTRHASGWLALPRVATPHAHGTGCTFASAAAGALARGFVVADALVLAKMATARALQTGYAVGAGAGPVGAAHGFSTRPGLMPWLSWGDESGFAERLARAHARSGAQEDIGLYGIVDSAERVRAVLAAGVRTVQLRMKAPAHADAAWAAALRPALADALAACARAGATLVVDDHWRLALELAGQGGGAHCALHLGQEDLGALSDTARNDLADGPLRLGVSSHSLWELARARSMAPWYIACGPVWPTLTKAMPWRAQGLDNLAWWVRMAGAPVVAIGGILDADKAQAAARAGAASICVVRGLGATPAETVPGWQAALAAGRSAPRLAPPGFPHPSLTPEGEGQA